MFLNLLENILLHLVVFKHSCWSFKSKVRSHDYYSIAEINNPSKRVCKSSIIKYLEEYVKHIGMCFLYLIKKYHWVRSSSHSFCKLTSFLIPNISWRCSNKPWYCMFFHILRHIKPYKCLFSSKQILSKGLSCFSLTNTCWTEEHKHTYRSVCSFQTNTVSSYSLCYCFYSLRLINNPFV